jgi:hypothetical protein
MNFRHLPEPLRPSADAVVEYFEAERGIRRFVEEAEIHAQLARPSLHSVANDHHFWCVEFSETTPYPGTLDRFVLDCMRLGLPIRLFVALPEGSTSPDYNRDLNRAIDYGVGVMEVRGGAVRVVNEPLSLSLAGVRRIEKKSFPPKYRLTLTRAENTFRQGNPAKGCSDIYDQIEALTRRIAKRTLVKSHWKATKSGQPIPAVDLKIGAWAAIVRTLMQQLSPKHPPHIPEALLARVLGVTQHRNDAGHEPNSKDALIRRDRELRTRFETASDLLLDLINSTKALRV